VKDISDVLAMSDEEILEIIDRFDGP
jgi:hypothetical protein